MAASSLPSVLPMRLPFDDSDSVEFDIRPTSSVTESVILLSEKMERTVICVVLRIIMAKHSSNINVYFTAFYLKFPHDFSFGFFNFWYQIEDNAFDDDDYDDGDG